MMTAAGSVYKGAWDNRHGRCSFKVQAVDLRVRGHVVAGLGSAPGPAGSALGLGRPRV